MNEIDDLQQKKIDLPIWEWPKSGWWLTAASLALGILAVFLKGFTDIKFLYQIALAIAIVALSPIAIKLVIHLGRLLATLIRRLIIFGQLLEELRQTTDNLIRTQETISFFRNNLLQTNFVEILRLQYFKQKLYLVVYRNQEKELEEGNKLVVLDTNDGLIMGYFNVTEVRRDEYIAEVNGSVDPLWMGYLRQTGESEMRVPANLVAILLPKEIV